MTGTSEIKQTIKRWKEKSLHSYELCRKLYKNDKNRPLELSRSQLLIFDTVAKKQAPDGRTDIHCETFTRFGKSLIVGVATLTRVATFSEKWTIIAPSDAKKQIIMAYVIEHIGDNEYTKQAFVPDKGETYDRLRQHKSKEHLTFQVPGGVGELLSLSAQENRQADPMDALMGFGGKQIIIDESSLIDDIKHAAILRMLGDVHSVDDSYFLFEIGNPFRRNHFYEDSLEYISRSKRYFHIVVDWRKGLKEGRITRNQVERMRNKPGFDILYGCKFPPGDTMDRQGWIPLLTYDEVYQARHRAIQSIGRERLGIDVAEGGCCNSWVGRTKNRARIIVTDNEPDLMKTADNSIKIIDDYKIMPENAFIDANGVGAGVFSRIFQLDYPIHNVIVGETAEDKKTFMNVRAELYWRLREWIRQGGCLEDSQKWDELVGIKYRYNGAGKIQIMSKKEMLSMGIKSPDVADSLALTFFKSSVHDLTQDDDGRKIGGYGRKG